jgi:hypothetical protein
MLANASRAVVAAVLLATPAASLAAQGASTPAAAAQSTAGHEFQVGPFYAGPRIWIGNLNGAIAIGGQVERGFTKPGQYGPGIIAGGAGIDYYTWSFDYPFGSYKYSVIPFQAFGNYHFVIESNKKFDPYVGLALVYNVVSASWEGAGSAAEADASSMDIAGQAGLRYFLSDKLALQGQLGFGYGTLGLGATWRF